MPPARQRQHDFVEGRMRQNILDSFQDFQRSPEAIAVGLALKVGADIVKTAYDSLGPLFAPQGPYTKRLRTQTPDGPLSQDAPRVIIPFRHSAFDSLSRPFRHRNRKSRRYIKRN